MGNYLQHERSKHLAGRAGSSSGLTAGSIFIPVLKKKKKANDQGIFQLPLFVQPQSINQLNFKGLAANSQNNLIK